MAHKKDAKSLCFAVEEIERPIDSDTRDKGPIQQNVLSQNSGRIKRKKSGLPKRFEEYMVKKAFPCSLCKKEFKNATALRLHAQKCRRSHDRESIDAMAPKFYQCHACFKKIKTEPALKRHKRTCKAEILNADEENTTDYKPTEPDMMPETPKKLIVNCLFCTGNFEEGKTLQDHMTKFHKKLQKLSASFSDDSIAKDNEDEYILP